MSVRQENRWRRMLAADATAINDRRREVEAAFMPHGPRPPVVRPAPAPTRRDVRRWMRASAEEYETSTQLAEGCCAAMDLPCGWLDDPTHWIWEDALDILDAALAAKEE